MVTLRDLQTDNNAQVVRHIFNLYEFVRAYMLKSGGKGTTSLPYINKSGPLVKRQASKSPSRVLNGEHKKVSKKSGNSVSQGMVLFLLFLSHFRDD